MLKIISGLLQASAQAGASVVGLLQTHLAAQKVKAPTRPQQNSTQPSHALFPEHELARTPPSIAASDSVAHRAPLQFTTTSQGAPTVQATLAQGLVSALRLPLVTDTFLNALHASLAHPRAPGPEIEQVLPHANRNEPLRGQPNVLPPALKDPRTNGYAQNGILGNFVLPGRSGAVPHHAAPAGYESRYSDPRDSFHFAKPVRSPSDSLDIAEQIDSFLNPEGRSTRTIRGPSSQGGRRLSAAELEERIAEFDFPERFSTAYIYPEYSQQSKNTPHSSLYGIQAVYDQENEMLLIQLNLQAERPPGVAPIDAHTAVTSLLNRLDEMPQAISIHPSELAVPQIKELAQWVNHALDPANPAHAFLAQPVVDALSKHITALKPALAEGYQIVGVFDESKDGPGLLLTKVHENTHPLH